MRCVIDLDKTVFSGGRASLLRPLPSFRNGAARTGRRDFLGLVGLYTGAKVRHFRRTGKKSAFYSLRPPEKQLFRHLSLVFPSLFQAPHPIHIAVTHHIIEASTLAGAGKPSVLHPDPQRRRQTVEHVHQAVERRHALPQAEGRHRTTDKHATRRVSRSVAGVDQNPLTSRHLHQARQSRPPGRRPSAGRAGKAWRNHVEAQGIFARGNGRMRPRSGRFERGHGRLSALGGKKQHPLRAPGQVGGAAQTNQCRHLGKIDVVNEIRAPLAAPVTNDRRRAPRSPRRTTANPAARRERENPIGPPCGARRKQQGMPPPKSLPHNRKPRSTAGA